MLKNRSKSKEVKKRSQDHKTTMICCLDIADALMSFIFDAYDGYIVGRRSKVTKLH